MRLTIAAGVSSPPITTLACHLTQDYRDCNPLWHDSTSITANSFWNGPGSKCPAGKWHVCPTKHKPQRWSYCTAVGLVDGTVTPRQFKEERFIDKGLHAVMHKVRVVANTEFEPLFPKFQPSQVTITTSSGKQSTKGVDVPNGDPRDPMTAHEIGVKFHALGNSIIGQNRCSALVAAVLNLESVADIRTFVPLALAKPQPLTTSRIP